MLCQSQWPRGLRSRSVADRLLRLWVRIPQGGINVRLLWVLCIRQRSLWWARNLKNEETLAQWGLLCQKKRICWYIISIDGFTTMLLKGLSNQWSAVSDELLIHNTYKCWRIKCTGIILALKYSICDFTFLISLAELHCAMSNMFVGWFVSVSWRKSFLE